MNLHANFYQILVKRVAKALESCKICLVNYICGTIRPTDVPESGSLNKQRNEMIEVVLFVRVHLGWRKKNHPHHFTFPHLLIRFFVEPSDWLTSACVQDGSHLINDMICIGIKDKGWITRSCTC